MNYADPCNEQYPSNFIKDYTETQVANIIYMNQQLIQSSQSSQTLNNIIYKIDDIESCIDPIRNYN
tara:strand:- start:1796 stop:1993 length:198 start_codon:yes stop_codon:yes gene_type:complete